MKTYKSVSEFAREKRLVLPRPHCWYLVSPDDTATGQVNAVPTVRGTTVASNGILLALETETGDVLIGHRDWFVKDVVEPANNGTTKPRSPRSEALANKYV